MEQTRPQVAVGKGTTMKYLCLLACEPDSGPALGSAEFGQMLAEFGEATSAMAAAGVLVDSGPLQPPETAYQGSWSATSAKKRWTAPGAGTTASVAQARGQAVDMTAPIKRTHAIQGLISEFRGLQLYRASGRNGHGAELRSSRARRAPEGSGAWWLPHALVEFGGSGV